MDLPPLWSHQEECLGKIEAAQAEGCKALCITSPTGGGKTRIMAERARRLEALQRRVLVLTNRRLLLSQTQQSFADAAVAHGVLAAGYERDVDASVQLASIPTLAARCFRSQRWYLPPFSHVLVDEAQANCSGDAEQLIGHYLRAGAVVEGYTATPIGVGNIYKRLIIAGTKAELRAAGVLVPCHVFAPDEPNMKGVVIRDGEFAPTAMRKRVTETMVFGDVFDTWDHLNPDGRATLVWAPGVEESRWLAEMFRFLGVTAAHIDGDTPKKERQDILAGSKDGTLKVVCSFGVMREGIDMPWLYHGILLQACAGLSTYYQLVGRLMRAYPDKDHCQLQDHAGAWWRHGSPNSDKAWKLEDTNRDLATERVYSFQAGEAREPQRCPRCNGIRMGQAQKAPCPYCGHEYLRSVRMIRMAPGQLVRQVGNVHKRKDAGDEDSRVWRVCLWAAACCANPRTVAQAAADFRRRTGHSLPPDLPLEPAPGSLDWHRTVPAVYPFMKRRGT